MKDRMNLQLFAEKQMPEEQESFEELIRGRYKEEFNARVQKILEGRLHGLRQENEQLMKRQEMRQNQQRQSVAALMEQEERIREMYSDFSLEREMENPDFVKLIAAGVDGRTAYEVVHREELLRQAMDYASRRTGERMASAIASGGARVGENRGRNTVVSRNDPRRLTSKELSDIRRRVQCGEKIKF